MDKEKAEKESAAVDQDSDKKGQSVESGETNLTLIVDTRETQFFRNRTFSNFRKVDVRKRFLESLLASDVETSYYWAAEMICSGQQLELIEDIVQFMSKHISVGSPKLPIYISMRVKTYLNIFENENLATFALEVRNSVRIRKLFAELVSVLAFSAKKPPFEMIKFKRDEEFVRDQWRNRLKAKDSGKMKGIFKKDDPDCIFIACNELFFALESKEVMDACYWVEWLLEFDLMAKKRTNKPLSCASRHQVVPVQTKYVKDVVWIIWEIILQNIRTDEDDQTALLHITDALVELFCFKYNRQSGKRRKYLFYHAVFLQCEHLRLNVEVIPRKRDIEVVIASIDNFYQEIASHALVEEEYYGMYGEKDRDSSAPARRGAASAPAAMEEYYVTGKNIFGEDDSTTEDEYDDD
jgi:hypothetical protein